MKSHHVRVMQFYTLLLMVTSLTSNSFPSSSNVGEKTQEFSYITDIPSFHKWGMFVKLTKYMLHCETEQAKKNFNSGGGWEWLDLMHNKREVGWEKGQESHDKKK